MTEMSITIREIKRVLNTQRITIKKGVYSLRQANNTAITSAALAINIIHDVEKHFSTTNAKGKSIKRYLVHIVSIKAEKDNIVRFTIIPNNEMVETYNMLNPSAGPVMIEACDVGSCCDPATETYHSM